MTIFKKNRQDTRTFESSRFPKLVQATDKDGNPVMIVINPDSMTAVMDLLANQLNSGSQGTSIK
jgi:hypothetical protein